jgi:signal peptidase II
VSFLSAAAARRGYFLTSCVVVALDQLTKILAHANLRGREPVVLIPDLFNLTYSRNPGGLFGYFSDLGDPWRTILLTVFPLAAVALIAGFLAKAEATDRPTLVGLSLILGGAVGNLIDRLFRGEVVDFLDVYAGSPRLAEWFIGHFGTAHWPTFNVSDSAIVTGACLLLLSIVRPQTTAPSPSSPETAAGPEPRR